MSQEIEKQAGNAFNFIQKLFFEISYLIKEIEGLLAQEPEKFVIGRPSGYGVTTRSSTGLEPFNVDNWLPKSFTVFFCPEEKTTMTRGQTVTRFSDDLRLLLLDIELAGKDGFSPRIAAGAIHQIRSKREEKKRFEQLMAEFAYQREKLFATLPQIDWESSYLAFKGDFVIQPLFGINSSNDVVSKIVEPMLEIYRKL